MSTAQEIITDAYSSIGRGSEIQSIPATLSSKALDHLRSVMETLRKQDIILAETVSGVTTTIALPASLSDELNEPTAARMHLVNLLAVFLIPISRADMTGVMPPPPASYSIEQLSKMYRSHTIPTIKSSDLLPRGQGSNASMGAFFDGDAFDVDSTS